VGEQTRPGLPKNKELGVVRGQVKPNPEGVTSFPFFFFLSRTVLVLVDSVRPLFGIEVNL
jgi:hypothetical protein